LEIPRGRGVLKAKILEAKYEAKVEFPGGRGDAKQKPSMGGVWILSGATHYIDNLSVLVENTPLVKFIRNYIQDSSGVFSISSLVRISTMSFPTVALLFVQKYPCLYNKKKIT